MCHQFLRQILQVLQVYFAILPRIPRCKANNILGTEEVDILYRTTTNPDTYFIDKFYFFNSNFTFQLNI